MSAEDLIALLLRRRLGSTARVEDLFDLAELLRTTESIDRALEDLPRAAIESLAAGRANADATALALDDDDAVVTRIEDRGLLAADARSGGPAPAPDAASRHEHTPDEDAAAPDAAEQDAAERRAAEQAFAAMSTLAELLRAVDDGAVRELAKGGIGTPLARTLAETAGSDPDSVVHLLTIAVRAGLVDDASPRWALAPSGSDWLLAPWPSRWTTLVASWRNGLRPPVSAVLDAASGDWTNLAALGAHAFPAGGDRLAAALDQARADAEALGILDARVLTPTGRLLFERSPDAEAAGARVLPRTVPNVYLQADLTVIAPGPLTPSDDDALRRIARIEAPGLAARYRFSDDTVRAAFRSGLTRDEILATLERLSGTGVPQPLRYLVDEAAARDTSVVVDLGSDGFGAVLRGSPDQLDLIGVDADLRHLGWRRVDGTTLTTRSPLPLVVSSLEDQRYTATLASAARPSMAGGPPDRRRPSADDPAEKTRALVERLLSAAESDGRAPEQEWIGRQVDLAVRERTPLSIVVRMPDDTERTFTIVPTAIAGGRVRGREVGADVERTLPLSLVVRVEAG